MSDGWGTPQAWLSASSVLPKRHDVVGQPRRLECGIHAPHQPRVLGRHAGRAVIGVTPLRLDAADRHHRLAAHVDQIAAEREREHGRFREAELARSDEDDPLMQAVRGEDLLHAAEAHLEWQRDVVGEDQRPGARAAFTAVDGDEVHAARAVGHQPAPGPPRTPSRRRRT